jgi:hypothetical protein
MDLTKYSKIIFIITWLASKIYNNLTKVLKYHSLYPNFPQPMVGIGSIQHSND